MLKVSPLTALNPLPMAAPTLTTYDAIMSQIAATQASIQLQQEQTKLLLVAGERAHEKETPHGSTPVGGASATAPGEF